MVALLKHTLLGLVTMLRRHGTPTHNLCDRPVPSVINSVSWSTSPYFSGCAGVRGGNRRRSDMEESKSEACWYE